jgi:hypothetical protein
MGQLQGAIWARLPEAQRALYALQAEARNGQLEFEQMQPKKVKKEPQQQQQAAAAPSRRSGRL